MKHKHEWEYEFIEGRFSYGWRGDKWCVTCGETRYSREAMRMQMFGPIGVRNPPNSHEEPGNTADHAMFRIDKLTV